MEATAPSLVRRLSLIDRFLPLWIFLAMGIGIVLGNTFPDLGTRLDTVKLDTVSLPIAIGLLWMMYPVLAKVRYGEVGKLRSRGPLFATSLFLNWFVGPLWLVVWIVVGPAVWDRIRGRGGTRGRGEAA